MEIRILNKIQYWLHPGKCSWFEVDTGKRASLEISNLLFKSL